jgi:predicted aspartyl protease
MTFYRTLTKLQASLLLLAVLPATPALHAAEAPACTYAEVAAIPIRYVGNAMAPAVDGLVNGAPATVLVHTGASLVRLTMNGVYRHNLGLRQTRRQVQGFSGKSPVYTAQVTDFAIGPARTSRRLDLDVIAATGGTPAFDAIAGAPFLLQSDLEIDLRAKRMRFLRPSGCEQATAAAPWKEDTIVIPFTNVPEGHPNPHFTVVVNGHELDAIIDTGSHRTRLLLDAARKVGIDVTGPGVKRLNDIVDIGLEKLPYWSTKVKTIEIGNETIRDAEVGIVDARNTKSYDLMLGRDFLRNHRVLFSMSQRKLYIANLGGETLSSASDLSRLIIAEANAGNPDAQYVLSTMYRKSSPRLAKDWLDKAAANGEPHAIMQLGRQLALDGQLDEGIRQLRSALDLLPADRHGPLWLYTARVRNGVPQLARRELEESLAKQRPDGEWPKPVADFYLGTLNASALLDIAARDSRYALTRTCESNTYIAEWHEARGDAAQAASFNANARAQCGASPSSKTGMP